MVVVQVEIQYIECFAPVQYLSLPSPLRATARSFTPFFPPRSTSIGMSALCTAVYSIYAPALCTSHASLYWKAAFSLANGPCHNGNCRWILCEQFAGTNIARHSGENFFERHAKGINEWGPRGACTLIETGVCCVAPPEGSVPGNLYGRKRNFKIRKFWREAGRDRKFGSVMQSGWSVYGSTRAIQQRSAAIT